MTNVSEFSRTRTGLAWWLATLILLAPLAKVKGDDFTYMVNFPDTNTVTITGYIGLGGAVDPAIG